jgi:GntR family phosphonate transport system transcriptional regulator
MSLYAFTRDRGDVLSAQIARQIEHEIGNRYTPGQELPGIAALVLRFGVDRHTLQQAIEILIGAGRLTRSAGEGIGVFVSPRKVDDDPGCDSRTIEELTGGAAADSRIVRRATVAASAHLAQQLALAPHAPVLAFDTLCITHGQPVCLSSHFISLARFPAAEAAYRGGSLQQFLSATYDCQSHCTESVVSAGLPDSDSARLLQMQPGMPVLQVKRLHADRRDGTPLAYVIARFRADRVQLRTATSSVAI